MPNCSAAASPRSSPISSGYSIGAGAHIVGNGRAKVHRDADDLQPLGPVGVAQLLQQRHLAPARRAPGGPEIDDQRVAEKVAQRALLAGQVRQRQIRHAFGNGTRGRGVRRRRPPAGLYGGGWQQPASGSIGVAAGGRASAAQDDGRTRRASRKPTVRPGTITSERGRDRTSSACARSDSRLARGQRLVQQRRKLRGLHVADHAILAAAHGPCAS